MRIKFLAMIGLLLLAGCGPAKPVGNPYLQDSKIISIDFRAAYTEKRCSKGCHYEHHPDVWRVWFTNIMGTNQPDLYITYQSPDYFVGDTVTATFQDYSDHSTDVVSLTKENNHGTQN